MKINFNKRNFYNTISKNFSYIYHNLPSVASYTNNGKQVVLDNLLLYEPVINEFINKKWITKSEIPPKIKSIQINQSIKDMITNQKQFKYKKIVNLDENILRYMYDGGYLDKNYFLNILFEKNEIDLYKEILDKIVMNGYVIKYFDEEDTTKEYEEYNTKVSNINNLVRIFNGEQEMSKFEKNLELIYLSQKWKKYLNYKLTKNKFYQCIFTENDLMNSKGFIWLPENEFKKDKFNLQKIMSSFSVDDYLDANLQIKKLGRSQIGKIISNLTVNEYYYKNIYKVKLMAQLILSRLFIYLNSQDFSRQFDCELDFYIFNAMVSLHLWLICQRLQNFKRSKLASDLVDEIMRVHKSYAHKEFQQIDTLRKISKFKNITEIYEDQKNTLHWHFNIYNPTVENNFYKIDALVWSQIFREKVNRYDDRVYKMSHYIIHHFHKFRELTIDDFENFKVNFDLNCIPTNYKDIITLHNTKLSDELINREKYSDFIYKKYHYDYKQEIDKDTTHLKKTFIRQTHLTTFDKKNYNLRSRREEDKLFDELKDEENKRIFEEKMEREFGNMKTEGSILNKLFDRWMIKNFGESIDICEREDLRREREEYNEDYLKNIGKEDNLRKRFSESLDKTTRDNLYKYRYTLNNNPKAETESFKQAEMKILHPDANVVTSRRKRKPLVDRLFNLKPY